MQSMKRRAAGHAVKTARVYLLHSFGADAVADYTASAVEETGKFHGDGDLTGKSATDFG